VSSSLASNGAVPLSSAAVVMDLRASSAIKSCWRQGQPLVAGKIVNHQ
jgi:hypothetical protein